MNLYKHYFGFKTALKDSLKHNVFFYNKQYKKVGVNYVTPAIYIEFVNDITIFNTNTQGIKEAKAEIYFHVTSQAGFKDQIGDNEDKEMNDHYTLVNDIITALTQIKLKNNNRDLHSNFNIYKISEPEFEGLIMISKIKTEVRLFEYSKEFNKIKIKLNIEKVN